jgi:2'-5' RNA ligase
VSAATAPRTPVPLSRLFAAIDPPPEVREALGAICRDLEGARWTKPEQMHLTLRFLGAIETARIGSVVAALSAVTASSFDLAVEGFGVFPSFRSPRVLWAGLSPADPLRELARETDDALIRAGVVAADEKLFSPHVTLARFNGARPAAVRSWIERREGFRAGPWEVSEFFLYASRLTPGGAIHTRLETWGLAGASVPGPR